MSTVVSTIGDDDISELDRPFDDYDDSSDKYPAERRLVIAIDYGTTYTGVCVATPHGNYIDLKDIEVNTYWGEKMGNSDKIPSVISYSDSSEKREQQWGASLSPNAVAMINTKLELDLRGTTDELDLILQTLDGVNNLRFQHIREIGPLPDYPCKGPEAIVTDYLTRVFDYLLDQVDNFSEELRRVIPVDIVLTIPADWTYRARNSTFRALTNAGFNRENFPELRDIMLISEPEAAAIYTARHLKEVMGKDFLKLNECFVLCDAGGGTVDCVSYRVKSLEPLELEKVTPATSAKCGATFIDLEFKRWLLNLIGEQHYRKLDPHTRKLKFGSHDIEGGSMRALMKEFDIKKRQFTSDFRDIRLDLPEPLENLNLEGRVRGGEIKITNADMKSFFNPQISQIVEMIKGQVARIERLGRRAKNIFLIGGFGESPYLREILEASLGRRNITLRRPDTSWTAVVRGAAICGVEKTNAGLVTMTSCKRFYGVSVTEKYSDIRHNEQDRIYDPLTHSSMAEGQLMWLIKKGDLLLTEKPKTVEQMFTYKFPERSIRKGRIKVYTYADDDAPERVSNAREELEVVRDLTYDLMDFPLTDPGFIRIPPIQKGAPSHYAATFLLTMSLRGEVLDIKLTWNGRELNSAYLKYQD